MGGAIQGQLAPKDDDERQKAIDAGYDLDQILSTEDLVSGETSSSAHRRHRRRPSQGVQYYAAAAPRSRSSCAASRHGTNDRGVPPALQAHEYSAIDFTGDSNAFSQP